MVPGIVPGFPGRHSPRRLRMPAVRIPDHAAELLDSHDVARIIGVCRYTLIKWLKAGTFPPPDVDLTTKNRFWRRDTVLRVLAGGQPRSGRRERHRRRATRA